MKSGTFQRHEVKYLLDSRQRAVLERAMRGHMEADEYGESTICSLSLFEAFMPLYAMIEAFAAFVPV